MGYGMLGHSMIQFQNSYGTQLVNSLSALAFTEESLVYDKPQIMEQGMYANISNNPYYNGPAVVQGGLTFEASPIALGWLLKSAIGVPVTTSDTNLQTHVFKPRTADFDNRAAANPMTIEMHRDVGSAAIYYDMIGNNFTLNAANGELLSAGLDFIGGGFSRKAAGTPTFPTARMFKWDQLSASFNGAAILDLQDLSITFNNNLEARYVLVNCNAPYRIKRSDRQSIELSGTFVFDSHSYWDAYLANAGSDYPMVFDWKTNQTPAELKIEFPKVRFLSFEPHPAGPGLVEASFTAAAIYHTGSATAAQITLANTLALFS